MSLHIGNDKQVIVKVPIGTPNAVAIFFMNEKKNWILKQIAKVEKQSELAEAMGPLSADDIKVIKKKTKVLIPQRVEHYASLSGITYNCIFIRYIAKILPIFETVPMKFGDGVIEISDYWKGYYEITWIRSSVESTGNQSVSVVAV